MIAKLELPEDVRTAGSLDEAARLMAGFLGLPGAIPTAAMRRALDQPEFARALVASRRVPALRDRLLADGGPAPAPAAPSGVKLAGKAAASVLKWGMEGLRPAAPWVIRQRLAACETCEFRAPAPDTLVYRGARVAVGPDATICTSCHCLINTKAAISTEKCPEPDPEDPTRSRWGEPWVPPEQHPKGPW